MIKTQIFTKKILISASLGLGLSLAMVAPSVALADFFSSDNPIYVGGGFGKSKVKNYSIIKDQSGSVDIGGSNTLKTIFVGKQYNKNIDIEGFYIDAGKVDIELNAANGTSVGVGDVKTTFFGLRGVYKFSLDGDFKPYISAGYAKGDRKFSFTNLRPEAVSLLKSKTEDDASGFIAGVGVLYPYSSSIKLRAEYTRLNSDENLMWGGISTTF